MSCSNRKQDLEMSCSDQPRLYQRHITIETLVLPQPHVISASQSLIASKSFSLCLEEAL